MKKVFLLFFMVSFMSCQNDIENFKLNGVISNEEGSPLEGIEVKVICWYYGNSPDQSYSGEETKKAITNNTGKYEMEFEKGAFIEILVDKSRFSKVHETLYITNKTHTFNIKMKVK